MFIFKIFFIRSILCIVMLIFICSNAIDLDSKKPVKYSDFISIALPLVPTLGASVAIYLALRQISKTKFLKKIKYAKYMKYISYIPFAMFGVNLISTGYNIYKYLFEKEKERYFQDASRVNFTEKGLDNVCGYNVINIPGTMPGYPISNAKFKDIAKNIACFISNSLGINFCPVCHKKDIKNCTLEHIKTDASKNNLYKYNWSRQLCKHERENASKELYFQIVKNGLIKDKIAIIAHSYGGEVAVKMLYENMKKLDSKKIHLSLLGTPLTRETSNMLHNVVKKKNVSAALVHSIGDTTAIKDTSNKGVLGVSDMMLYRDKKRFSEISDKVTSILAYKNSHPIKHGNFYNELAISNWKNLIKLSDNYKNKIIINKLIN
jgi:hypothetical protein